MLEARILRTTLGGTWLTAIEIWIALAYPDGPKKERRYGYAPVYQAIVRLERSGYIERRQRDMFGVLWAPDEFGISEAGMAFMDAWKDGD